MQSSQDASSCESPRTPPPPSPRHSARWGSPSLEAVTQKPPSCPGGRGLLSVVPSTCLEQDAQDVSSVDTWAAWGSVRLEAALAKCPLAF